VKKPRRPRNAAVAEVLHGRKGGPHARGRREIRADDDARDVAEQAADPELAYSLLDSDAESE
jgi:hypothetical protein